MNSRGFHGGRIDSLGIDEKGLFSLRWLMDHRSEYRHLVRDRLGATAAAQALWSAPGLICVADDFTRYDVDAVQEHRRSIDLVRYRYFGTEHLGLEPVASVTGLAAVPGAARRRRTPEVARRRTVDGAMAVDEVLLGGKHRQPRGPLLR